MKKELHPSNYRFVVYQDEGADFSLLTRSTVKTNETVKWKDGQEYPLVKVHISSASHPFYTGEQKVLDIEGRVDKFEARRKAAEERKNALANKAKKNASRAALKTAKSEDKAEKKPAASSPAK